MSQGSGRKKKAIIVLKKTAPHIKKQLNTGKLKVVRTTQAEKIAKAVVSLIPRPKGKKKSTIESRMVKTKKESIKLPFEELISRRLGKEEAIAEKQDSKKPRKERADKGFHRYKYYLDRGEEVPSPVQRLEESKKFKGKRKYPATDKPFVFKDVLEDMPAPLPEKTEIIVEPAPAPIHITIEKTQSKKTSPPKSSKAPIKGILARLAEIKPPQHTGSKTNPIESKKSKIPELVKKSVKPIKKPAPKASPETDEANSSSESSIFSSGDEHAGSGFSMHIVKSGTGSNLQVSAPKKSRQSRSQLGV